MQRRDFTTYLSGVLLSGALPLSTLVSSKTNKDEAQWFASASEDSQGKHWLIAFDQLGAQKLRYPLPSRAHQVLKHPFKPWLFVIGRRPGHYLLGVDMQTGELVADYQHTSDQHFCGHMQISADGKLLYTTENITRNSHGLVVVRDIDKNGRIVKQFPSGGLGPHQLLLSHDGQYMVVANGGIHTLQREKMNLDSMSPNLSYIRLSSQVIEEKVSLNTELSQLSIRHIDLNQHGDVVIAMQYQGERTAQVPLVALHKRAGTLSFLNIPDSQYFTLQHYCGSACFDKSGETVAISAPRGDKVLFWSLADKKYLGSVKVRDGCGLAIAKVAHEFVISSGRGRVYRYNVINEQKTLLLNDAALQWDNHLAAV